MNRQATKGGDNEKNVRSGQQGTNQPWIKPGQSSQDPSLEKSKPSEEELSREHQGVTKTK
jgi:hypothetical protein